LESDSFGLAKETGIPPLSLSASVGGITLGCSCEFTKQKYDRYYNIENIKKFSWN